SLLNSAPSENVEHSFPPRQPPPRVRPNYSSHPPETPGFFSFKIASFFLKAESEGPTSPFQELRERRKRAIREQQWKVVPWSGRLPRRTAVAFHSRRDSVSSSCGSLSSRRRASPSGGRGWRSCSGFSWSDM